MSYPTKPSETSYCKHPELCDKMMQCHHWLAHLEGCAAADCRQKEKEKADDLPIL